MCMGVRPRAKGGMSFSYIKKKFKFVLTVINVKHSLINKRTKKNTAARKVKGREPVT